MASLTVAVLSPGARHMAGGPAVGTAKHQNDDLISGASRRHRRRRLSLDARLALLFGFMLHQKGVRSLRLLATSLVTSPK